MITNGVVHDSNEELGHDMIATSQSQPQARREDDRLVIEAENQRKQQDQASGQQAVRVNHKAGRSIDVLDYPFRHPAHPTIGDHNFSKDVADRNIASAPESSENEDKTLNILAQRLKQKVRKIIPSKDGETSSSGFHEKDSVYALNTNHGNNQDLPAVDRKPLEMNSIRQMISSSSQSSGQHHDTQPAFLDSNTEKQLATAGINLDNVTKTLQETSIAPAVTKETVQPVIHEIQTERITRDIHNTHIVHRILPIVETEHLPARHFVKGANGELIEVAETDVDQALGLV